MFLVIVETGVGLALRGPAGWSAIPIREIPVHDR